MTDKARANLLWTAELEQTINQPPLVSGAQLLLAALPEGERGKNSSLQALNLADGGRDWTHTFEFALINGLADYRLLSESESLFIVCTGSSSLLRGQGGIYAFDHTGRIVWQWRGDAQHYSAPAVRDGQLYVTAGANTLLSLKPNIAGGDDDVVETPLPVSASLAAPAVHDAALYIPCRSPDLLAVSPDCAVQWQFQGNGPAGDWLDQTPVVAGDRLFTTSRKGTIFALAAVSGQHLWRQDIGQNRPLSRPAVTEDRVYVGTRHGLTVLDSQNGQTIWTLATTRAISAAPVISGDIVYAAGEDHVLYALDCHDGQELWRWEMSRRLETAPALGAGCLVVVDRGGAAAALERPSQPEPVAPEPVDSRESKQAQAAAHEKHGEFEQAARLWLDSGALEKAAAAFEQSGHWSEAAALWQQSDRYGKRAEALERHAQSLAEPAASVEAIAAAWEEAARAHAEIGQTEARRRCEREAARFRQLPILTIEIEPEAMVVGSWSKVNYTVRNEGFGSARNLDVRLMSDRFEAHAVATQTIITLTPGRVYQYWFDVSPQVSGHHVPLQLAVEYLDKNARAHHLERTFHVAVADESGAVTTGSKMDESLAFARLESPDGRDLARLRQQMVNVFSAEDVNQIIFDLGLNEDDFDPLLSPKVRKLIVWAVQQHQIDALIELCREQRPQIEW